MKKGPWSPEEDLLLATYVHEHGAGNWRAVPTNTGLMRCGKSCRLRWTNYLRPGIKRGNFSDQEEKLIIDLQLLFGNKWSAIASYMPNRTDNDIKNFYNTHLKRKIAKTGATESGASGSAKTKGNRAAVVADKGKWERHLQMDMQTTRQAFQEALSMDTALPSIKLESQLPTPEISPALYPYSVENIRRLLEDWPRHPGASGKASVVSGGGEGESGGGTAHTLEPFTGRRKVEGADGAGMGPSLSSFPMLESWLLDDGMEHGDMCVPLADPREFF